MKKLIMIFAIAIVLTAAGGWIYKTVSAEEAPVVTTTTTTFTYGPMMGRAGAGFRGGCGGYGITTTPPTYEWLYLHLDTEEKTLVDAYHADLLATYDFSAMDAATRLAALSDIRAALADYIVESAFVSGVNP